MKELVARDVDAYMLSIILYVSSCVIEKDDEHYTIPLRHVFLGLGRHVGVGMKNIPFASSGYGQYSQVCNFPRSKVILKFGVYDAFGRYVFS